MVRPPFGVSANVAGDDGCRAGDTSGGRRPPAHRSSSEWGPMTRRVTFSMSMSLDGYVTGPDGGIDWSVPSDELFQSSIDECRGIGVHLMGRRLYETMRYWDDPEQTPHFDEKEREWASLWNPLPKVVFSRTLTHVDASARLATRSLAEEIEHLRGADEPGDIAIGGATLAHQAAALGLIDEYLIRVCPVLLGGGTSFFAHDQQRAQLELLETRSFPGGVLFLRYGVRSA